MVIHLLPVIISTFLLVITQSSAHFFPNISSIPPSLIPNKTAWQDFKALKGCHKGIKQDGLHKMKEYFQYFGYLDSSYKNLSSDEFDGTFESAVKFYQQNFNLNATGELDDSTLSKIVLPRCGNADVVNGTSTMYRNPNSSLPIHAVSHYTFFPNTPRWPRGRTDLTYSFEPENQLTADVRGIFGRAFERWSEVTVMTFTETNSTRSDIRIGFYTGDHGDGEPFDGVLGTLAHAFAPTVGRFHLDGAENWITDFTMNSDARSGVDLESVAVHEIGHLLGLGHSSVENAIMYPTISTGTRKVELDSDDIEGVQVLYGANPNYNGSTPALTPRNQRDVSGSIALGYSWLGVGGLLVVGLLSVL